MAAGGMALLASAGVPRREAVAGRQAVLGRALDDAREVVREGLDLDLVELPGDPGSTSRSRSFLRSPTSR
jgi:hypothetical protein